MSCFFRRMRRRERNKVAATKCRNKKKLKTQILVKVSFSRLYNNNSNNNILSIWLSTGMPRPTRVPLDGVRGASSYHFFIEL